MRGAPIHGMAHPTTRLSRPAQGGQERNPRVPIGSLSGMPVLGVLAVLSPFLSVIRALPQVSSLVRSSAEGVSFSTWAMLVLIAELWTFYGIDASVPAEVASNIPNGVLALAVVVLVARRQVHVAAPLLAVLGMSAIVAIFAVLCRLHHVEGLESGAAVASSLLMYLPQCVKVFRERDLDGVASASWLIACAASVSWGVYGFLLHKPPIYLPNLVMLPLATAILVRTTVVRRGFAIAGEEPAGTSP